MKFPRSLLFLVLAACSSTSNVTNISDGPDGGDSGVVSPVTDSGLDAAPEAASDSGTDADADAGPVEGACGNDQSATSQSCTPNGPCSDGACSNGYRYVCAGQLRPPIEGCQATTIGMGSQTAYCCPPKCVRNANDDGSCSGGQKEYLCPTFEDGGLVVAAPSGCSALTADTFPSVAYCCP